MDSVGSVEFVITSFEPVAINVAAVMAADSPIVGGFVAVVVVVVAGRSFVALVAHSIVIHYVGVVERPDSNLLEPTRVNQLEMKTIEEFETKIGTVGQQKIVAAKAEQVHFELAGLVALVDSIVLD